MQEPLQQALLTVKAQHMKMALKMLRLSTKSRLNETQQRRVLGLV
jgi:hypothetical protein